jgi:hypothetical protein
MIDGIFMKRLLWVMSKIIAFVLCSGTIAFGQAAVPFITISPDSRANGMGEVGTGLADNIYATHWNVGGLAFQMPETTKQLNRKVGLAYAKWLPQFNADLFYAHAAYGQYVPSLEGTINVNFMLMNLGEFKRTDFSGKVLNTFRSFEFALGFGYGTLIADDIGAGFQLKYIQSNLGAPVNAQGSGTGDGIGRSVAFDLGMLWRPSNLDLFGWDIGDKFGLGFNLANIGPKVTYLNVSDPLPTTLRLGTSLKVLEDEFNELTLAVDIAKLLVRRDSLVNDPIPKSFITAWEVGGIESSFGMEYWYEKVVALRAGYFTEPASVGNRRFFTFGTGIRYDVFNMDFSFIIPTEENHPLGNTMRFSLIGNIP